MQPKQLNFFAHRFPPVVKSYVIINMVTRLVSKCKPYFINFGKIQNFLSIS